MTWEELLEKLDLYVSWYCDAEENNQYADKMYMWWLRRVITKWRELLWHKEENDD